MARLALKLTFGMLMISGCCSVASAQAAGGAFMVPGSRIEAPKGFVEMCSSDATFCAKPLGIDQGDPTLVTGALATKAVIAEFSALKAPLPSSAVPVQDPSQTESVLRRINEFVNARVAQKTDLQVYGREEVWRRSGVGRRAAGDCEDIAIEKRFQLIASGFPAEQLYFAVVYERQVGLHTVLIARVADGDYVLDSRTPYVKRWDHTSYTFVSIQSQNEPMQWHSLSAESLRIAQQQDGSTKTS